MAKMLQLRDFELDNIGSRFELDEVIPKYEMEKRTDENGEILKRQRWQ